MKRTFHIIKWVLLAPVRFCRGFYWGFTTEWKKEWKRRNLP